MIQQQQQQQQQKQQPLNCRPCSIDAEKAVDGENGTDAAGDIGSTIYHIIIVIIVIVIIHSNHCHWE